MLKNITNTIQRMRRTPYQSVMSISLVCLVWFSATVFFLDALAAHTVLRYFETRPQVNAFFKQEHEPTQQEVDDIKDTLQKTGKVKEINYVSKEQALEIYKKINNSNPFLTEAVTTGMLPASIEVSTSDPRDLKEIAQNLKQVANIEDVRFAEEVVSSLTQWTRTVRWQRAILTSAQLLIAFIVIITVISSRVTSKKEEISLLRLVGATDSFVSIPFVIEGAIHGICAAVFGWTGAYIVLLYSTPYLVEILSMIPNLYPSFTFMLKVLLSSTLMGAFVGSLAGWMASSRFKR